MKSNIFYLKENIEKIKTLFLEKKFETVIKKSETLLKKNLRQSILYNFIGLSYIELNQYDKAINLWLAAISKMPPDSSFLSNIGLAYMKKWNFFEARKYFFSALKVNSKHFQSYINLGNMETFLNNDKLALNYYLEAYKINNNFEEVLMCLILSHTANGNFDNAKNIIKELNTKFPNNTKSYQIYSKIHNYQNQEDHRADDIIAPDNKLPE